jgi:hypothetical protein
MPSQTSTKPVHRNPTNRRPTKAASFKLQASRTMLIALTVFLITAATFKIGVFHTYATAGQYLKLVTSDGGSTFYVGRCFRTDIRVQTDSLNANSVDVIIPYNPAYVEPYTGSGCTVAATSILSHSLFPAYPLNSIAGNKVQVTAYDPSGTDPVNTGAAPTDATLGHLYWKVISASGSFNLRFDFTAGSTTDTNMAEQSGDGTDVLDGVENLSLVLADDSADPTFSNLSPLSGATNVSVTTGISYTFNDAGAGINTASLTTALNGTSKSLSFSGCTETNSNRTSSCNVTVGSVGTLSYATVYRVTATGSDVASPVVHTASTTWSFTTEDDTDAPYVENLNPTNAQTNVGVNSNIVLHIKDYKGNAGVTPGLGVDIATVQITVTPQGGSPTVYTYSDPEFGYSGTNADYTITLNPADNFPQNTQINVSVEASDLHSPANAMSTYAYTFTTSDSQVPVFSGFDPAQSATGVAPDANVIFHITDSGAGIDLDNTTVTIAGVSYTHASPQFSHTGTAADYTITINPTSNFTGGQIVTVSASTQDLAGTPNTASTSYSFTARGLCTTCFVDGENPARFTVTATLSAIVSFHVKDTGTGIQQTSIKATLTGTGNAFTTNPLVLTGSSPLMTITGTPADYLVTITLPAAIELNKNYSIFIEATDLDSVPMADVSYTFMKLSATSTVAVATSCSACVCSSAEVHTGGGNRNVSSIIANLKSEELPQIIILRHLPGTETVITEELPSEETHNVDRCYIDESEITHAAATESQASASTISTEAQPNFTSTSSYQPTVSSRQSVTSAFYQFVHSAAQSEPPASTARSSEKFSLSSSESKLQSSESTAVCPELLAIDDVGTVMLWVLVAVLLLLVIGRFFYRNPEDDRLQKDQK